MSMRCGCSNPGVIGCTCVLIDSDCIDVDGNGEVGSEYTLSPILSLDANQLLTCESDGLRALVTDVTISRKVFKSQMTIPNNAQTAITFEVSRWASSNPLLWDSVINPSRLTVPTGGEGKYLFVGMFQIGGAGSFQGAASIYRNGALLKARRAVPVLTNFSQNLVIASIIQMEDGDYAELKAFQNSGSIQTAFSASFSGCRLAPLSPDLGP